MTTATWPVFTWLEQRFGGRPALAATAMTLLLFAALLMPLFLVASSLSAVSFTVTLTNGTTFETRYRPTVADWDENYVMLRTDMGNWISLSKDDVADVSSPAEITGFGYQVDSSTLFIGFTPGDITVEGEEGEGQVGPGGAPLPPDDSPITYGGSTGGYGLDQFLDIPQDGVIFSQPVPGAQQGDQ